MTFSFRPLFNGESCNPPEWKTIKFACAPCYLISRLVRYGEENKADAYASPHPDVIPFDMAFEIHE